MLDIKYGSVACIYDPRTWEAKARDQKFKVIHSSKFKSHLGCKKLCLIKEKIRKKIFDSHDCFLELKSD